MNEGDEPVNGDAEIPSGEGSPGPRDRSRRPSKNSGQASGNDDWDGDDWDDDDWDDDGRGGSGLDLRLVGAIVAAVVIVVLVVLFTRDGDSDTTKEEVATPSGEVQPDDDQGGFCGNWPASFGGDGSNATVTDGVHVWSDFGGIHVRSNLDEPVTVKLSGNSDFSVSSPGTAGELSAKEGKEITAEFEASDGSDGPDFDVSCYVTVLNVEVTGADGPLDASQINLGGSSVATENPYKLVRDPA